MVGAQKNATRAGRLIQEFCCRHQLWAYNMSMKATGPLHTHEGPTGRSSIDYVLIPEAFKRGVNTCGVLGDNALNTSDHNPVFVTCNFQTLPSLSIDRGCGKILRWSEIGQDMVTDRYTNQLLRELEPLLDSLPHVVPDNIYVDNTFSRLMKILHKAALSLPRSRFRKHLKPY